MEFGKLSQYLIRVGYWIWKMISLWALTFLLFLSPVMLHTGVHTVLWEPQDPLYWARLPSPASFLLPNVLRKVCSSPGLQHTGSARLGLVAGHDCQTPCLGSAAWSFPTQSIRTRNISELSSLAWPMKTVNTPWDFSPKFIPSSFWGEMRKKIAKATATILCHLMLFQLNQNTSSNCFSLVTISLF